jgi:hypothetical protein
MHVGYYRYPPPPHATRIANDKGGRVHLSDGAGQIAGNPRKSGKEFPWRMRTVRSSNVVSGTEVVNASGTHDTHYTMPCHYCFRNCRHDCINIHNMHYAADHQSRAATCP